MKPSWLLPLLRSEPAVVLDRVLVEYNGPQIAIWKLGSVNMLGVASDEDATGVRWVAAALTNTELKALADGAVAIRDVLLKSDVIVFDVDHAEHVRDLWHCPGESLQDEHLPEPGARLPTLAREGLMAPAQAHELCLEGAPGASLTFRSVSQVLDVFQRLWRSIAQAVTVETAPTAGAWGRELTSKTELALAGASTGSLVIFIGAGDEAVASNVASHLDAIARAGANKTELAALMQALGPRVQGRYDEMLSRLETHGLVMLYRDTARSAFLAGYSAPRVRAALPSEETTKAKAIQVVGSFLAFDTTNCSFVLRDESDESYDGAVERGVIEQNPAVAVGDGAVYSATLSPTVRTSGKHVVVDYTLVNIAKMAERR